MLSQKVNYELLISTLYFDFKFFYKYKDEMRISICLYLLVSSHAVLKNLNTQTDFFFYFFALKTRWRKNLKCEFVGSITLLIFKVFRMFIVCITCGLLTFEILSGTLVFRILISSLYQNTNSFLKLVQ